MAYECIRIKREANGYEVELNDPKIVEENRKRDAATKGSGPVAPWKNPERSYTFKNKAEVMTFIESVIDIALPKDEYSSTFDKAAAEATGAET